MIFGSKNKRQRPSFNSLTEEEIRNRLYGSAVGITVDTQEPYPKRHKDEGRTGKAALVREGLKDERVKIQKELGLLKKELEKTKRKLDRMRGLRAKKLRLLSVYLTIFLTAAVLTAIIIRQFFNTPKISKTTVQQAAVESGTIYSIQVAVYGDAADAQRFSSDLNSKGYQAFVKESRFASGKPKFNVYVGGFKDKKSALTILDRLRTREGIKDGFVTSVPE